MQVFCGVYNWFKLLFYFSLIRSVSDGYPLFFHILFINKIDNPQRITQSELSIVVPSFLVRDKLQFDTFKDLF